jgi:hypothetical protein
MIVENIRATGRLTVQLTDAKGVVKESHDLRNLVVTTGLGFIASRMKDATADVMSHMAVGEGTTPAVLANTALEDEIGRAALTSTTVTGASTVYEATFAAGIGTGAITEAGIFNDALAGTMLCRTVFPVVNKGPTDTLQVTWTVTVS